MNDSEILIRQIERIMINPEEVPLPQLKTLAVQFASHCKELNDSLVTIMNNIYSGNYGEALRAVEAQHILENYNILNFPGLSDWKQICSTLNLAKPVDFAEDLAERINELYDTQTPLLPFQKMHRKLSISRAPLSDRLKVLYKLDSLEPTNLNWHEMITKLEQKRDEELESDYNQICEEGESPKAFKELYDELTNPRRKTSPPQDLFVKIKVKVDSFKRKNLMQSYRLMVQSLTKAYQEMDFPTAKDQLATLQASLQSDNLSLSSLPDDVQTDVKKVLSWMKEMKKQVARQDEFQMQLARMKQGLAEIIETDRLRRIYNNLTFASESAGIPIPDSVTYAYQKRIQSEESQKTRALALKIILIVTICLLVAGITAFFIISHNIKAGEKRLAEEIAKEIETIEKGCGGKAVETADKFVKEKNISDKTKRKPAVSAELSKLTSSAAEVDRKYRTFSETLSQLSDMLETLESKYNVLYDKFENEEVDDEMRQSLLDLIADDQNYLEKSPDLFQTLNGSKTESDKETLQKITSRSERLGKKITQIYYYGKDNASVGLYLLQDAEAEMRLNPDERKSIDADLECLSKIESFKSEGRKPADSTLKNRLDRIRKQLKDEKK